MAADHEPMLLQEIAVAGSPEAACMDPVEGHWLFSRPILDAWWRANRVALLTTPMRRS
jgi:hypothetical protein